MKDSTTGKAYRVFVSQELEIGHAFKFNPIYTGCRATYPTPFVFLKSITSSFVLLVLKREIALLTPSRQLQYLIPLS